MRRLSLELVPKKMWGKNVRSIISRENWDALRWGLFATTIKPKFCKIDFGYISKRESVQCLTCGSEEKSLELHEEWDYDDVAFVQRLVDLVPVCEDCHLAMHYGRANQVGLEKRAEQQLVKITGLSQNQVQEEISSAFEKWRWRSQHEYKLEVSFLNQWIPDSKIHLHWLEHPKRWVGDRLDAINWARTMLDSDAVIVDTETTGLLDYPKVEVLELAILTTGGEIVYESRFRPRYRILKRTVAINGITNEAVRGEPTFKQEYKKIFGALNSKIAIAYKAKFDEGVIQRTCDLYKLEPPDIRWECAMYAYRAYKEVGRFKPLPNSRHTASGDCLALLELLKQMARNH